MAKGYWLVQGDMTTCGGKILEGAGDHTLSGKAAARDSVSTCPCNAQFSEKAERFYIKELYRMGVSVFKILDVDESTVLSVFNALWNR